VQDSKDKSLGKGASRARGKDIQDGGSHTSAKQVAANRHNALRSTGPRTPAGKRASKLNAIKHGLRANEVVIPGQEDPAEFRELVQSFYDDLRPQGCTESCYVDDIALAEWRLRRARRVELGEIRTRQLDSREQSKIDVSYETAYEIPSMLPIILPKSTRGIRDLMRVVAEVIDELRAKGTVSQPTCARLDGMFGNLKLNPATMLKVWFPGKTSKEAEKSAKDSKGSPRGPERIELAEKRVPGTLEVGTTMSLTCGSEGVDPAGAPVPLGLGQTVRSASGREGVDPDKKPEPKPDETDQELKAKALEYLNNCLEKLETLGQIVAQQEELRQEINSQCMSVPKEPDFERLRRYEIAFKRDRDDAIEKLEALQNRRGGTWGSQE
jgi:hypothetical protein